MCNRPLSFVNTVSPFFSEVSCGDQVVGRQLFRLIKEAEIEIIDFACNLDYIQLGGPQVKL